MKGTPPVSVETIPSLRRREAKHVAHIEYERLAQLVNTLSGDDWVQPTECDGWDVTAMARHLLGAMAGNASVREYVHQLRSARHWSRQHHVSLTDGLTVVQIADRIDLPTDAIARGITETWPRALAGRFVLPGPIRRTIPVPAETPAGKEIWSLRFLLDVIYTRDAWMHRIDISRATGKEFQIDDHDGRVVADVVADWSRRHSQPFRLRLTGAAGGMFISGEAGPTIDIDAIEFARTVSGREHGTGLLATLVPF